MIIRIDGTDLCIKMTIDESIHTYGGDLDYNKLENKPSINGTTLEGAKTLQDLGVVIPRDVENENLIFS